MEGIIGCKVYIPQWDEKATVTGFDADTMCYYLTMSTGDEAYVPLFYVEVLH